MIRKLRLDQWKDHLAGVASSLSVFAVIASIYGIHDIVSKSDNTGSGRPLSTIVDTRPIQNDDSDKFGLELTPRPVSFDAFDYSLPGRARVGAIKALDRNADIRVAYELRDVCRFALSNPTLASHVKGVLATWHNRDSSASPTFTLVELSAGKVPCGNSVNTADKQLFLLVTDRSFRTLAQSADASPAFVAVGDTAHPAAK